MNGLGTTTPEPTTEATPEPTTKPTTCAVGKDCPEDQVCDKLNCVSCEEGLEPDESHSNCIPSMFYHSLSTTIKDNFNTFKWSRYNMCSRQGLP